MAIIRMLHTHHKNGMKRGVKMHGAGIFSFISPMPPLIITYLELLFFGRHQMGKIKRYVTRKYCQEIKS